MLVKKRKMRRPRIGREGKAACPHLRELVFEGFDAARSEAYATTVAEVLAAPNVYRKRFRARRGRLT